MSLSVEQQKQINVYLKRNPKVSREQAIIHLFGGEGTQCTSTKGLEVESNGAKKATSTASAVLVKLGDKTYNLNKTIELRINNVSKNLKKAEDSNGFMGSAWSGFKNLTGIGDSSDKVREKQEIEQKLLVQFNANPQKHAEIFEKLTGQDYNPENLLKFIKGEIILPSELALNGYKEGQEMAVDVGADIVSGVAAVGIYTAAVAAAPFTGGASIAVGVAAATATGAALKTSLKAGDALSGGREYSLKDAGHDAATGAFSGILAPVTGGMGGAVGKTVATKLGVQAVKTVGKEVAEEAVESGVKQTVKTILTNPTGYEYVGGSVIKRATALGAEMAVDGAAGGAVDNAFRTALDGGSVTEVLEATGEGAVGGLILSPVIGGGVKIAGKGVQAAKNAAMNSNIENILVRDIDVETVLSKVKNYFNDNTNYDNDAVKSLTEAVNSINAPFLDAALDVLKTNKNANYLDVLKAMECITPENQQFALSILKNKNVYPLGWGSVLQNADENTIQEFQELIKSKSFCKKHIQDLEFINKDNIDLYKAYYNDVRFSQSSYTLTNLLESANQYNKDYIKAVLEQSKQLDASYTVKVSKMLESINNDLRKNIADKIIPANINDIGQFDFSYITNIIFAVNEKNKAFLSGCIDSKKFSMSELSNIIDIYNIDMSVRPDVLQTDNFLRKFNSLSADARAELAKAGIDLAAVERYIKGEIAIISTTKEGRTKFLKNVLANNNEKSILNTDFSSHTNNGVKEVIDDICAGIPEFRTVANSSAGIKTLQILQDFMKSSEYKSLSDADKTIGKLSILLSSVSESPDGVLSRYNFNNSIKSRIINILRNKELITDCLHGKVSERNVVANFRNIEDYKIAEHIIKSNSANSITANYSKNINTAFNELYSGQKFLFTSHILNNGEDFPTVNYNGKDIKVLNLSNMVSDEDLAKFGFPPNTTPENVTFNVHMTNDSYGTSEAQDIDAMLRLSNDQFRDFVPSSTLIKGNKNSTFMGYRYGIILKNDQMNIGTLGFDNVTGLKKGRESFVRLIFDTESSKGYRDMFMKSLAQNGVTITEQEYAQLAKKLQSAKYLTQIHDIKIGDKSIKAEQIKEAVNECTNHMLESEVTSFNPGIEALYAKVNSLDECPEDFIELAHKSNLPIVLQGDATL